MEVDVLNGVGLLATMIFTTKLSGGYQKSNIHLRDHVGSFTMAKFISLGGEMIIAKENTRSSTLGLLDGR